MESKESESRSCWNSVSHTDRLLTDDERAKLESDNNAVSNFKQIKLEKEAQKNWDLFYKRNTTKFFKDRHWTRREFEELCNREDGKQSRVFFEVGCGVGNFMFPLLEDDDTSFFYACDFSPRAVEFVKTHPAYNADRCNAFQCDITCDVITENVPEQSVDVATLIFVLSAICPEKMQIAVENIVKTLRPGGTLLFRDYGLYDHAMLRFAKGHKLSDCFYVRQDGTRAYYFSLGKVECIMRDSGLDVKQCSYVHRATVNKKEGINVERTFVQGKFVKPDQQSASDKCNVAEDKLCNISPLHNTSPEEFPNSYTTFMSDDQNDAVCGKSRDNLSEVS